MDEPEITVIGAAEPPPYRDLSWPKDAIWAKDLIRPTDERSEEHGQSEPVCSRYAEVVSPFRSLGTGSAPHRLRRTRLEAPGEAISVSVFRFDVCADPNGELPAAVMGTYEIQTVYR